ncbi:hypothetical protein JDV09_03190 [Mycobacterium sp. Y57]|uniref:DUF6481 family protein n=1 Tax=Mycolicibacterium xanthum TaxID=2796469 RepID=UPI001C8582BC|nr:DUF6481 family protein [Mycolicibacterium xanthum]MBX7431119.1 hypothetical protein [Mycolicibacterium xanthum]
MSDSVRSQIAQIAAHTKWAQTQDRTAATAPARKAMLDKFEKQVDPDGVLTPAERAKRAANARKAHFQRLALKSAQARRRAKEARAEADQLDAEAAAAEAQIGGAA